MLAPPAHRAQTAYDCGSYSLLMAIEAVHGAGAVTIQAIIDKARMWSDSMGGIFNMTQMLKIISELGYTGRKVSTGSTPAALAAALGTTGGEAVIIPYSAAAPYGLPAAALPAHPEAGDSAHWSVVSAYAPAAGMLDVYNPWPAPPAAPAPHNIALAGMHAANGALKQSRFDWKFFVEDASVNDPVTFEKALKDYKNDKWELLKRGRASVSDLGGSFIAVS